MWFRRVFRRRRSPPPVLLPSLERLAELIERELSARAAHWQSEFGIAARFVIGLHAGTAAIGDGTPARGRTAALVNKLTQQ